MEEMIYKEELSSVHMCLRSKLKSDKIARKLLTHMEKPGWIKKKLTLLEEYCLMKCFLKMSRVAWKYLIATCKVMLMTWDMVKIMIYTHLILKASHVMMSWVSHFSGNLIG